MASEGLKSPPSLRLVVDRVCVVRLEVPASLNFLDLGGRAGLRTALFNICICF